MLKLITTPGIDSVDCDLKNSESTHEVLHSFKKPRNPSLIKKITKHPWLMHYHRLFLIVLIANFLLFDQFILDPLTLSIHASTLSLIAFLSLTNFAIAIVIRQHYVVNCLFWLATRVPKHWPLPIRALAAKVYHFGGIHSGGTFSGTLWFALFFMVKYQVFFESQSVIQTSDIFIDGSILLLLVTIIATALPQFRSRFHNHFEVSHRLLGWTVLILFWLQFFRPINEFNSVNELTHLPYFWSSLSLLLLISLSVALPWLRLKKIKVDIQTPSRHVALSKFNYGVTPFAGSSTALSRRPLFEWHSFANIPAPHQKGFRLAISRAGDWTGKLIDDKPETLWVKGIPTAGVGNIDQLFNRVVWVATGSGIGPCLPHLLENTTPSRLLWVTKNPRKTFGDELIDEILNVQPNAVIWDTDKNGKPDMLDLTLETFDSINAEAVICISNKRLTWQVVYGCEQRGIPAYGAIWDS